MKKIVIPKGKDGAVLLTAMAVVVASTALLEVSLLEHTNGNISFPTNDAFLDISTAKYLAYYKVWGVSKYLFQPATTSLLYPLLLSMVFFITGAHLVIPIVVNELIAMYFLYVLQKALIKRGFTAGRQLGILLAVVLFAPLPLLVVSGMGYALQLLTCFLFIETVTPMAGQGTFKLSGRVYVLGLLSVAAGYEDILLVFLACGLLVAVDRKLQALKLAGVSLLPILLFGVISILKGSSFLPTPFITSSFPGYLLFLVSICTFIGALLILQYRQLKSQRSVSTRGLSFALLVVMVIPFCVYHLVTLWHFERESIDLYEQQYLPAAFAHRYYHQWTIGTNEMGAIAYFAEGRKLDLAGVVSIDVAKSRKAHTWTPALADTFSRKFSIRAAIIFEPWFDANQLSHWARIASWELTDPIVSARKTVSFYAANMGDTVQLRRRLHDFEARLPATVTVHYY